MSKPGTSCLLLAAISLVLVGARAEEGAESSRGIEVVAAQDGWEVHTPFYDARFDKPRGILRELVRHGSTVQTLSRVTSVYFPTGENTDWEEEDSSPAWADWETRSEPFAAGGRIITTGHDQFLSVVRTYSLWAARPYLQVRYEWTCLRDLWTCMANTMPGVRFAKTMDWHVTPDEAGPLVHEPVLANDQLVGRSVTLGGRWYGAYNKASGEGLLVWFDPSEYGWFRQGGASGGAAVPWDPHHYSISHPALTAQVEPLHPGEKFSAELYLMPYRGDAQAAADLVMRELKLPQKPPAPRCSNTARRVAASEKAVIWTDSSQTKIFKDTIPPTIRAKQARLGMVRNEYEAFQIAVTAREETLRAVRLTVPEPLRAPTISLPPENIIYNPVGFTLPGGHPDPLLLDRTTEVPAGETRSFWVTVYVPPGAPPGRYSGTLIAQGDNLAAVKVRVSLRVFPFTLPNQQNQHLRTDFGLWENYLAKFTRPGRYEETALAYARNYDQHRLSGRMQPGPPTGMSATLAQGPGGPELQGLELFDRIVDRQLHDYHFNTYCLPAAPGLFSIGRVQGDIDPFEFTESYSRPIRTFYRLLSAHLRKRGSEYLQRGYIYLVDEPVKEAYDKVKGLAQRVREGDPGLKIMVTMFPEPELYGLVDIWCPNREHAYELPQVQAVLAERKERGEEIWWYDHSVGVMRLSHPALESRLFFWSTWKFDIGGVLGWCVNYWPRDPWQVMEDNGDGRLLYPNPAGSGPPVNSIRWELIRDGVEDYEMLYSLRERVKKCRGQKAARLRRVVAECERMTPGRKGYVDDPARFAALRERVLEALP